MKFYTDIALKVFFLFSTIPFLLSEKLYDRYDFRLNTVADTLFTTPQPMGELDNKAIDEASGIVASHRHPGFLYTHNDSGGDPDVFIIDTLGRHHATIRLEGAENKDWEDIAIGPGEDPQSTYVYVGDIGDNDAKREKIQVYRFPEPSGEPVGELKLKAEKLTLVYPDGPRDAETLMVDPWTGDLFILSKRDTSNTLYKASVDQLEKVETVLEKVTKIPVTMAVGGDISADGKQILIKNYWAVYYWERAEGESVPEALAKKPLLLPYKPEPQGEAIGFSTSGDRYYTLSEVRFGIKPVLYQYLRLIVD